ncbi:MAG: AmmeMemoRadiSam system radical SAM enzyme [Candidatus Margulisbacteria bacterium GWF2_35_9]|nr:MAG: AmmeMemoRadiSam system radical SAM enzyme [Candidatus Margulisbacteria bacterium GWF2_35_9]
MKEARYYSVLENKRVQCELCLNHCRIGDGQKGYCQIRVNKTGKLWTETFNKYSSIAIDPIEKKPLYHFYPGHNILSLGSIGCNFRCKHCQNWEISQPQRSTIIRPLEQVDPLHIVDMTIKNGLKLVAFTYNEPLINSETIFEAAKVLKAKNIKIVLVTNGFVNLEVLKDFGELIDAYSIDLKAFTKSKYRELTGVDAFETVKNNIEFLVAEKRHVELVTNLVTDINDDEKQIEEAATWIFKLNPNIPWHISMFRPMLDYKQKTPISNTFFEKAILIAKIVGLKNVYGRYEDITQCQNCKNILVARRGFSVLENNLDGIRCKICKQSVPCLLN